MSVIHRHEIPVDDQWHTLILTGSIVHIASRRPDAVEVWALHQDATPIRRLLRVYGTGHDLPVGSWHVGTAIVPGGSLVWHLMEQAEPDRPE